MGGRRRAQRGQGAKLKEGGLTDARRLEGCRGAGSAAGAPEVRIHRAWRFFPASDNEDRPNAIQSAEGSARPPWSLDKCHPQVTAEDSCVQTHSSHGALSRVGPVLEWAVSCVQAAMSPPRSPVLADSPLLTPWYSHRKAGEERREPFVSVPAEYELEFLLPDFLPAPNFLS